MLKDYGLDISTCHWQDTLVPWSCYRAGNLIYFRHFKCATSTYLQLFDKKLKWEHTDTQQIDWDKDKVFSYIRDPLKKHYKGIVEGLTYFPGVFDFFYKTNDPNDLEFLAQLTSIEPHSYTIHRFFGDRALNVHWIPIDTTLDHKQATYDFLQQNGYEISKDIQNWFNALPPANESTEQEKHVFNKLISTSTRPDVQRYIDFDVCLYDSITKNQHFVPHDYKKRILELKQLGNSQTEAELIADAEIKSGQYLLWSY